MKNKLLIFLLLYFQLLKTAHAEAPNQSKKPSYPKHGVVLGAGSITTFQVWPNPRDWGPQGALRAGYQYYIHHLICVESNYTVSGFNENEKIAYDSASLSARLKMPVLFGQTRRRLPRLTINLGIHYWNWNSGLAQDNKKVQSGLGFYHALGFVWVLKRDLIRIGTEFTTYDDPFSLGDFRGTTNILYTSIHF